MTAKDFLPLEFQQVWEQVKKMHRCAQRLEPLDLKCRISPDTSRAAGGHTFAITLECGPALEIPLGARLFVEVPATWDCHLGSTFRRGVSTLGAREQITSGYGAFIEADCPNCDAEVAVWAHHGRISDLVEMRVVRGGLKAGEAIRLVLGTPDGNRVQVQKHAMRAVLAVAVDLNADETYRFPAVQPSVQVRGAWADSLRLFAPATVRSGEAFPVRVLPVDIYARNAATDYRARISLAGSGAHRMPEEVDVDTVGDPLGATFTAHIHEQGPHRISAIDVAHGIAGRSNPIAVDFLDDRRIFFGELHSQMWDSMGTGTNAEYFERARDVSGLDFAAPANHYNQRYELTDEMWRECVETTNRFNDAGRFATLLGYEWGHPTGHRNVYVPDDDLDFFRWFPTGEAPAPESPEALWQHLGSRPAIAVPHHPKAFRGTDWQLRNDRFTRLVEICSQWGIAETGGPHCVRQALLMGHRLGFVGGTDSHYGLANQGSYHVDDGNGLAAVQAEELSRKAVWQALYERRTYATTGDRIVLDFSMDGHPMGSDLTIDFDDNPPRSFRMRVLGTHYIDKIELVRNDRVVFASDAFHEHYEAEWTDRHPLREVAVAPTFPGDRPFVFYYLRVTQRNRQMAWASPVWLTDRK